MEGSLDLRNGAFHNAGFYLIPARREFLKCRPSADAAFFEKESHNNKSGDLLEQIGYRNLVRSRYNSRTSEQ